MSSTSLKKPKKYKTKYYKKNRERILKEKAEYRRSQGITKREDLHNYSNNNMDPADWVITTSEMTEGSWIWAYYNIVLPKFGDKIR